MPHENNDTRTILCELIDEPAQAMRSEIPRDAIFEMVDDIRRNGLINPITVRPRGDRFEVVAGHRRFLAHRYGGFATIRCIVRELSDDDAFAIMTSENLKRENVNPVDEAMHTARLLKIHNNDIEKVAGIVGRSRNWVESRIEIGAMPDDVKNLLRTENIKLGVALALAQITDDVDRAAVTQMAQSQGASVVMAQYWLAQWKAGLFGHATQVASPDSSLPEGQRITVMLRCALDGLEHPASEFVSVLVHNANVGYVEAMREHLKNEREKTTHAPVAA